MACLSDVDVQSLADDEGTAASRAHVATCSRCRARVDERRREMASLAALVASEASITPAFDARVRDAVLFSQHATPARTVVASGDPVRGATMLRATAAPASWRRVGWVSALATAAGIALVVFLVLPRFGAPTSLSASEILGRSLQTLSSSHGIESLEYELSLAGAGDGPHRIEQLIDHDHPHRYRLANYGADGVLRSALSQDPITGRRAEFIRVDGRNYIVSMTSMRNPVLSLPQIAQAQMEVTIAMMQASADQNLSIVESPEGRQYVIQMPAVTSNAAAGMIDLYQARAVIDARDFRMVEFQASGALLKQPYSLSFKLLRRTVRQASEVPADEFAIHPGPGDVVLEGEATTDPVSDVITTVLRELGRLKGE